MTFLPPNVPVAQPSLIPGTYGIGTYAPLGARPMAPGTALAAFNPTANAPTLSAPLPQIGRTATQNLSGLFRSPAGAIPRGVTAPATGSLPYAASGGGLRGALGSATSAIGRLGGGGGGAGLRGALTGVSGRALLGRAGIGAFAGSIGSNVIDRFNPGGQNSNIEQGLQGAAMGAGIGAGVGSVVPVIGTALGAGIGGAIGGGLGIAGNVFGWGGEEERTDPRDQLNTWLGSVNITPDAARTIREQFEMEMLFAEDAEDKDAAQAQALQNAQLGIQQMWATEQAQAQQAERALAFQMSAQQYMAPHLTQMRETQNALSNYLESTASSLPPEFQPIARLTAHQGRAGAERMISAYANQVAAMSQTNALEQFYADSRNMAAQQLSAGIAQGVGGGGMSSTDLLAALTPQ